MFSACQIRTTGASLAGGEQQQSRAGKKLTGSGCSNDKSRGDQLICVAISSDTQPIWRDGGAVQVTLRRSRVVLLFESINIQRGGDFVQQPEFVVLRRASGPETGIRYIASVAVPSD